MTRLVHLARHATHAEVGRILSGRSDIGLSQEGFTQADRLAGQLAGTPLRAIYASPRRRALETAEAVARDRNLTVRTSPELDEIDFGAWTGIDFDALDADPRWTTWNERRGTARVPGGETMGEAVARARTFLDSLPGGDILCVSHCDIIRGVVASYLGLDLDRLLGFDCDPASVTTLALFEGGARLVSLNVLPVPAASVPAQAAGAALLTASENPA